MNIHADSLKALANVAQEASKKNDSSWILNHVLDSRELDFAPFGSIKLPSLHLFGLDISLTRHIVFMWLACLIVFFLLYAVARSYRKSRVPGRFAGFMELIIVFVRDEIAKPTIGAGYHKFLPYLLTAFFFILSCNFLGLIPYCATATGNLAVTSTLAVMTFLTIQIGGIQKNGLFGYFKGLVPSGVPSYLLPIMAIVELLGLLTKPFALAIRLFANMTAGHIVILSLIGLIFFLHSYAVVPVSVAFALFMYLLEILVALLQAYIFTMLSSLFIGMAVHQEH